MKKLILSGLAASIALSSVGVAAQPNRPEHGPGRPGPAAHRAPPPVAHRPAPHPVAQRAPANHRWAKGQRFDRRYAQNYREIDYRQYRNRKLYAPPRGYHWVQSGNDAVLVALTGGVIGAVLSGALN